eukprot:5922542-Amphidinium_carterae.1
MSYDEEELTFLSAESDVEPSSTANREGKQCSMGASCEQVGTAFFKGARAACNLFGGRRIWCTRTAFGVAYRPGATKPNMFSGCGRFFGVPRSLLGGTHVVHPADRAALSVRELQAPILDDEAWL